MDLFFHWMSNNCKWSKLFHRQLWQHQNQQQISSCPFRVRDRNENETKALCLKAPLVLSSNPSSQFFKSCMYSSPLRCIFNAASSKRLEAASAPTNNVRPMWIWLDPLVAYVNIVYALISNACYDNPTYENCRYVVKPGGGSNLILNCT